MLAIVHLHDGLELVTKLLEVRLVLDGDFTKAGTIDDLIVTASALPEVCAPQLVRYPRIACRPRGLRHTLDYVDAILLGLVEQLALDTNWFKHRLAPSTT
jgi:hypothetical protein